MKPLYWLRCGTNGNVMFYKQSWIIWVAEDSVETAVQMQIWRRVGDVQLTEEKRCSSTSGLGVLLVIHSTQEILAMRWLRKPKKLAAYLIQCTRIQWMLLGNQGLRNEENKEETAKRQNTGGRKTRVAYWELRKGREGLLSCPQKENLQTTRQFGYLWNHHKCIIVACEWGQPMTSWQYSSAI